MSILTKLIVTLLSITMFLACSASKVTSTLPLKAKPSLTTESSSSFVPLKVNQIVVYPLEGEAFRDIAPNKPEEFTTLLSRAFNLSTSLDIVKSANTSSTKNLPTSLFHRAAQVAKHSKAQAALCGRLTQFKDTDGTKYGATNPAKVHFQLWLVDSSTATPLWSAAYDSRQKPLTENILNLKNAANRKFVYQTANQILADGFSFAARSLEDMRQYTTN